ncbi:5-methylcytosine restriction system specificity protein McrC, partial [Anaerovibrio slackiae]|uniref:5-methylcytosine restriction system specificity protein McrC n=1 Tax=Anaerovibrio slackiae TaxID=2652309 RepID=UPI003868D040
MNNLFEVREFDIIASSAERKDDTSYRYLPPAQFAKLVRFVQNFSGEEDSSDVLNFLQLGYSRHVGQIVRVKNYVGLIQVDNTLQLQVYPKISFGDGDDTGYLRTKKVFMKMLCSMKDFPSKVFSSASLKVERMSIFELFISMYIHDVRQLVRYGIKSGYV